MNVMDLDPNDNRRIVKDALIEPDNMNEEQQKAARHLLNSMRLFAGEYCFNIIRGGFSAMVHVQQEKETS
jgi:hypothetical protein